MSPSLYSLKKLLGLGWDRLFVLRLEWFPVWLITEQNASVNLLLASHRSAYFSFPCFMLIIIPILVANAIICDTEPGPCLHSGFERCQLLFQSEMFFKQGQKAKSRDSKWSGIKGSLPEKSQLLWNGNQNSQWAQQARRWNFLELPRRNLQDVLETPTACAAGGKQGSIPFPNFLILPRECLKLLIWEGCFPLFLLNLCYQTAKRTDSG